MHIVFMVEMIKLLFGARPASSAAGILLLNYFSCASISLQMSFSAIAGMILQANGYTIYRTDRNGTVEIRVNAA